MGEREKRKGRKGERERECGREGEREGGIQLPYFSQSLMGASFLGREEGRSW